MASDTYHEPYDQLPAKTRERHRAIVSLIEELEAIDWYQQRADACADEELRAVLLHNKDEEIEHAMMILEWLRRREPPFDERMRQYLGAEGPIVAAEARAEERSGGAGAPGAAAALLRGHERAASGAPGGLSLGIGSLRGA